MRPDLASVCVLSHCSPLPLLRDCFRAALSTRDMPHPSSTHSSGLGSAPCIAGLLSAGVSLQEAKRDRERESESTQHEQQVACSVCCCASHLFVKTAALGCSRTSRLPSERAEEIAQFCLHIPLIPLCRGCAQGQLQERWRRLRWYRHLRPKTWCATSMASGEPYPSAGRRSRCCSGCEVRHKKNRGQL